MKESEFDSYGQRMIVQALRAMAWALLALAILHIPNDDENLALRTLKQAERELNGE